MGRLVKRVGRVIPAEVLDARAEAAAIVATAREHAAALLAEARAETEAVFAEARAAGEAAGRARAEAAFTTLLVAARADADQVRAAAVPAARILSLGMAEKIVGRTVQIDETALRDIAARALAASRARSGVVVLRVHPDDKAQLEKARPELVARMAASAQLVLTSDTSVGRAGCVVETPAGRLDARLETQLAAIERAVFGAFDADGVPSQWSRASQGHGGPPGATPGAAFAAAGQGAAPVTAQGPASGAAQATTQADTQGTKGHA